jgi:phosphatidylglycerophosphatase A
MNPAHAIATGFGVGLAPVAPGTFGTLAAWPLGWWLSGLDPIITLPVIGIFFILGIWACDVAGRRLGVADHGSMVWDEIVAFLLIIVVVPRALDWQAAAFVLFRAFDIAKPPPIGWLEDRFRGGFGVMLDDLAAAGYALLVLAVIKRISF